MAGLILDASALIAYLRDEPGRESVEPHLIDGTMCMVNYAEVATFLARAGRSRDMIDAFFDTVSLRLVPGDRQLAIEVGLLEPLTRSAGLSLGDRYCVALGKREGLPVMTADRAWAGVADAVGVEVRLIR